MNNILCLIVALTLGISNSVGQNGLGVKLEKTSEKIEKYKSNESKAIRYPVGFYENSPVFLSRDKLSGQFSPISILEIKACIISLFEIP